MKLRSTLAVALALVAAAAQAQDVYITAGNSGQDCVGCAGGGSGAEAWLVPRPGPQGYSHPATTVYAEKCCRDHYPGCCDNVWDGYCSERHCWHSDKAGRHGCNSCGPSYPYGGQRYGAYRGWSGGGWGWNPGYGGAPAMVQSSQPAGSWNQNAATPMNAMPVSMPASTLPATTTTTVEPSAAPQAEAPVITPAATGAVPSAGNWTGYPRVSRAGW